MYFILHAFISQSGALADSIIDWSNFYDGPYLHHLAKEYNDFDDTLHPKTTSQRAYTNHVYEFLLKKQLIK
jgi:hypothetical protein